MMVGLVLCEGVNGGSGPVKIFLSGVDHESVIFLSEGMFLYEDISLQWWV